MSSIADITAQPSSGLQHIDALLEAGPGWNWLAPSRNTIYYTFSLADGNAADIGSKLRSAPTAFNATQQSAAASALSLLTQITGIRFVATADGNAADIHFAAGDLLGPNTAGFCSLSWSYSTSGNTVTSYGADAYVYLDNADFAAANNTPTVGTTGFEVLLHELGHAMGLKHPFEGEITLPTAQDNTGNTLMSYTSTGGPHASYSPYDIAALMWLYGGDGLGGVRGQGTQGLYLIGTASADALAGGSGDDVIDGAGGNDRLDGGAGIDTARFSGSRAAYAITPGPGGFTVGGPDGTDRLLQVERLSFADLALAFDLDGNAGTVAKFLGAVFGKAGVAEPRYVGIGLSLADAGMGKAELMRLALDAGLGPGFSAAAEVTLLYQNLVGQAPSPDDLQYWTGVLASGQYSPVSLALMAAELDLNLANIDLVGLAHSGLAFS